MKDKLTELLEEKKRIEHEIKKIKNREIIEGDVKVYLERFPATRRNEWHLAVNIISSIDNLKTCWRSIVKVYDRYELSRHIDTLISDLKKCKDRLEEKDANSN